MVENLYAASADFGNDHRYDAARFFASTLAVTGAFLLEHGEDAAELHLAHFPCEELKVARSYEEHRRALGDGDEFRHEYGWMAQQLVSQLGLEYSVGIVRAWAAVRRVARLWPSNTGPSGAWAG